MRLICPVCDARYDIDDSVIPEGGRDVQCSSCGHTWYQKDNSKPVTRPLMQAPQSRPIDPAPKREQPVTRPLLNAEGAEPAASAPDLDISARKPLDKSIADILREEAAREKQVASGGGAFDASDGTAGQSAKDRAAETRRRIAQMTQDPAVTPAAVAAAATGAVPGANVDTVPEIDEINATLRARAIASGRDGLTEDEYQEVVYRRGFRWGFFFFLLLFGVGIAPYFFVDQIKENLPETAPFMDNYVMTVDGLRAWLAAQAEVASDVINDLLDRDGGAPDDTAPADAESTPTEG